MKRGVLYAKTADHPNAVEAETKVEVEKFLTFTFTF